MKLILVIAGVIGLISIVLSILSMIGFGALHINDPSAGTGVILATVDLLISAAMLIAVILGFLNHPASIKILWIACWIGCAHHLIYSTYLTWHPITRASQIDLQVYPVLVTIAGLTGALIGATMKYGIVIFLIWRLPNTGRNRKTTGPNAPTGGDI